MICAKCKVDKGTDFAPGALRAKYPSNRRCRACCALVARTYRAVPEYKEYSRRKTHESYRRARLAAIDYYSDGRRKCACCGEGTLQFLTLDHVNGDGGKHRKSGITCSRLPWWLRQNGYPVGFQVLCYNCNNAKAFYGDCPHQGVRS